jgi:hypothetical protein
MRNNPLLNRKFGIFVIAVSLCNLVGCASQYKPKMTTRNLIEFKTDCKIKDEQLTYLRKMQPSRHEEQMAQIEVAAFKELAMDYDYKKQLASGNVSYWFEQVIRDVEQCKG